MKIFITGVAGFLGSHLADYLISNGHTVVGNDNLIGGYYDNIPSKVEFHHIDCNNLSAMTSVMNNVDVVVHTAATAYEGLSNISPSFVAENVFNSTINTVVASINNDVKRFVFCSSMSRYGEQTLPFSEEMSPRPLDPYAISKVAAEDTIISLSRLHGFEWNIAVPHNIIGPRQRYDDPYRNVASIMINRNLQNKPSIIYGDGKQIRCFSHINDCIEGIYKLVTNEQIYNQVVNIGPDENPISINDLAKIIQIEVGYDVDPVNVKGRPNEVKYAYCSSDKARKILQYDTKYDIIKTIKDTANYIRQKGPLPFRYNLPLEIQSNITPITWTNKII